MGQRVLMITIETILLASEKDLNKIIIRRTPCRLSPKFSIQFAVMIEDYRSMHYNFRVRKKGKVKTCAVS